MLSKAMLSGNAADKVLQILKIIQSACYVSFHATLYLRSEYLISGVNFRNFAKPASNQEAIRFNRSQKSLEKK